MDALASPPPGDPGEGTAQLVAGLATEMLAHTRARSASDLGALGAAGPGSPLLDGIRSHFLAVVWQLLGSHARDQGRIWQASRLGPGAGWTGAPAIMSTAFASYMQEVGWAALRDRLPSLETLVTSVVELEIDAVASLLSRTAEDTDLLAGRFGAGRGPGPLIEAMFGLSDPHNGRKTVATLSFARGMRVIYKPRPVAMEQGLSSTLDWLRCRTGLDVPAGLEVLPRQGYGWCERVDWQPCTRPVEVDDYFRRLGALAGVLGALAATDCHAGNFIARGPNPVLVDAETLLHPRMLASPGFSVFETEILPSQVRGPAGQRIDYPGFDAPPLPPPNGPAQPNLPHWNGRDHRLRDHRAAFDQGLATTRRTLRTVGGELTATDGPLEVFAHRPARVVLRPTSVYGALLDHLASAPGLGSDDGGFARVVGELARYQDPVLAPDVWRTVQDAEIAALARADVPYFLADTTTGDLHTADGALLAHAAVRPVLGDLPAVVRQMAEGSIS